MTIRVRVVRKHSAGGSTDVRSTLASCLGCRSPGGEGRAGRVLDKGEVVAGERGRSWGGLAPCPPSVTGCQLDPLEHGVIEAKATSLLLGGSDRFALKKPVPSTAPCAWETLS